MAILLIACEDPFTWEPCNTPCEGVTTYPVYIDSSCGTREREGILDAIEEINEMSNSMVCKPVLKFKGYVEINHDIERLPGNGEVVCYTEEPEWFENASYSDKLGWGTYYKNVRLFIFKNPLMSDNLSLALSIHELMHYIGLPHDDNPNSVMYPVVNPLNTSLHPIDGKHFCTKYDCVN